jgi:hypothetical protein
MPVIVCHPHRHYCYTLGIRDSLSCDKHISPAQVNLEKSVVVRFRNRYDFGNFPLPYRKVNQILEMQFLHWCGLLWCFLPNFAMKGGSVKIIRNPRETFRTFLKNFSLSLSHFKIHNYSCGNMFTLQTNKLFAEWHMCMAARRPELATRWNCACVRDQKCETALLLPLRDLRPGNRSAFTQEAETHRNGGLLN